MYFLSWIIVGLVAGWSAGKILNVNMKQDSVASWDDPQYSLNLVPSSHPDLLQASQHRC